MLYVIIGVIGFVFLLMFDIFSLRNQIIGKYFFAFFGLGLIIFSTVQISSMPSDLSLPFLITFSSLILALLFFILLIYSVFIEVGLNTYEKIAEPELVTNGTYTLVRHPGVIWLFLTYFFGSLFFGNSHLMFTTFIWTMVNTFYIIAQERYILKKLFVDYDKYIMTTPMVIPNINSIKKFITTKNWRKE